VQAAHEPLRSIILAGLYAGLRIESEALTLRLADVDFRTGLLTVQSAYAKSGKDAPGADECPSARRAGP
jgi:integrase